MLHIGQVALVARGAADIDAEIIDRQIVLGDRISGRILRGLKFGFSDGKEKEGNQHIMSQDSDMTHESLEPNYLDLLAPVTGLYTHKTALL